MLRCWGRLFLACAFSSLGSCSNILVMFVCLGVVCGLRFRWIFSTVFVLTAGTLCGILVN